MTDQPSSATGHGVKQRALITMTPEEVDDYIAGRHTMTLCSINHDQTIHAVAMWYGFLEGALAFETKAKSQKVQNLRRNPTITCMVDDGQTYDQLRGVEIVGTAEIVEDPDRMWEAGISVFERYTAPYTEALRPAVAAMLHKRVVVKVHTTRVVSWDHRKLGIA